MLWAISSTSLSTELNCYKFETFQQVLRGTGELEAQLLGEHHLLPLSSLLILPQKDQEIWLKSQDLDGLQYTLHVIPEHQQGNKKSEKKNTLTEFPSPS